MFTVACYNSPGDSKPEALRMASAGMNCNRPTQSLAQPDIVTEMEYTHYNNVILSYYFVTLVHLFPQLAS